MEKQEFLEGLDKKRLEYKKKAMKLIIAFSCVSVVGALLWLLDFLFFCEMLGDESGSIISLFGILMMVAGIVGIFIMVGRLNAKFKSDFSSFFTTDVLGAFYKEGYESFPGQGLTYDEMNASQVFTTPDFYKSQNLFVTSYKGIKIRSSNFCFTYVHEYKDKDGHVQKVIVDHNGRGYIFEIPRKFDHFFISLEKGASSELYRTPTSRSKVEFESLDYNKKFNSYSSDQTFAFYMMTPQVQLALLDFDEKINSKVVFSLNENKMYVFLNEFSSKVHISILKKVTEKDIDNYLIELRLPLVLLDSLDLDKNKYLDTNLAK